MFSFHKVLIVVNDLNIAILICYLKNGGKIISFFNWDFFSNDSHLTEYKIKTKRIKDNLSQNFQWFLKSKQTRNKYTIKQLIAMKQKSVKYLH